MLSARKVLFAEQNVHQYNSWNILLTVNRHCALRFTVLVTTCTCFWRKFQLHFHQIYAIFSFQACPDAVLEEKTSFRRPALSIGPKLVTLLKKHGNQANFPNGALFSGTPNDGKIPQSEQSQTSRTYKTLCHKPAKSESTKIPNSREISLSLRNFNSPLSSQATNSYFR